jgi:hypothetical protein
MGEKTLQAKDVQDWYNNLAFYVQPGEAGDWARLVDDVQDPKLMAMLQLAHEIGMHDGGGEQP